LLRDLVGSVWDFHLIDNRIDIQIRKFRIRDGVRNGHIMRNRIGEFKPGEKDLLEKIFARKPGVVVRFAVEGSIEWCVVVPLGAVYPNRRPVESQ